MLIIIDTVWTFIKNAIFSAIKDTADATLLEGLHKGLMFHRLPQVPLHSSC